MLYEFSIKLLWDVIYIFSQKDLPMNHRKVDQTKEKENKTKENKIGTREAQSRDSIQYGR